jgi:enoyl-CoA hydratase
MTVDQAYEIGMVSKVFPSAEVPERTLEFARRIAKVPTMTSLLIKESVNQTMDNMGFYNAMKACFSLHELNHSHWAEIHGDGRAGAGPDDGVPSWKDAPPVVPAVKDKVRATR